MPELPPKSDGNSSSEKLKKIALSDTEKTVLIKALQRYKQKVPPYIQSNLEEIQIINSLIDRLSKRS